MKASLKYAILIAEDDPPVRKLISTILSDNGYEVLEAADGKAAIELYEKRRHSIDAIVSDLRMPNLDGVEFAKFNYENRNLPFIVCTAVADSKLALNLLKFGVQDYLVKPIDEDSFIGIVKNAVSRGLDRLVDIPVNRYEGNVGSIIIPSKRTELPQALDWVRSQVENVFEKKSGQFLNFTYEFLLNAYEHGSLKIGEEKKTRMMEGGIFESEIRTLEADCKARITLAVSVLKNEVAVNIADEGDGFDYEKYLNMSEEAVLERLEMPNGRGILMSTNYFNSIEYAEGGRSVELVKSFTGRS